MEDPDEAARVHHTARQRGSVADCGAGAASRLEARWWTGTVDEMRPVVAELVAFSLDVIMAFSNPAVALLKRMASTIPVVFVGVGDPIGDGFVSSLAHPGSNITGFAGFDGPIGGKWLEVLKETVPHITRVMMIMHPETPIRQARDSSATVTITKM